MRSGEEGDVEETTQVDAAALWRDVCVCLGEAASSRRIK